MNHRPLASIVPVTLASARHRALIVAVFVLSLFAITGGSGLAPSPALAVPANDNQANAIAITTPATSGIVATGNNAGATFEGGESRPCGGSFGATVWYTWTSPGTPGTAVFDTFGSNIDTVLAIYTGGGYPLANFGCNDDLSGAGPSALTLTYAAGTTYRIQMGGYNGATGSVVLSMSTGAAMYVNSNADTNASDGALTLREAMLLAKGGTGAGGLNRALGADASLVLNASAAGASASDLIHFTTAFPASTGATIALTGDLPLLSAGMDVVSGIGAGVIIQGNYPGQNTTCIPIVSDTNVIEGLDIRNCAYAVAVIGDNNRIGGSLIPGQRNFISGSEIGIAIGPSNPSSGNSVIGNVLGFRRDGSFALNSLNSVGIRIDLGGTSNSIGGSGPGEGNIVSLSTAGGIQVFNDNNVIKGNKIGMDPTGSFVLSNPGHGIEIASTADDNIIGGTAAGEGNIIAGSGQYGVNLAGGFDLGFNLRNTIRGNSIHSNQAGGISAGGPGKPVISSVSANAVTGTSCGLCIVDIYSDTGNQGRIYVGTTTADSLGFFAATGVVHPLGNVTATGTPTSGSLAGSTSDFSAPFAALTNLDGDGVFDAVDACVSVPEDQDAFQDSDGCPDPDNDADGICDAGMTTVGCTGSDQGRYLWQAPLGGTVDCRNVAEDFDSFHDDDGCPEPDNDYDTFPDGTDDCPATDGTVGADGIADTGDEPVFYLTPYQSREDFDGVIDTDGCHDSPNDDYDGDGAGDETEVFTMLTDPVNPDTDADTVVDGTDNCPNWPNTAQTVPSWTIPASDSDCDGFTAAREQFMGTDPTKHCNLTTAANDEAVDFWPSDFNDNRTTNLSDLILMGPSYNKALGNPAYNARFDLNASNSVSLADVILLGPFYNKSCA